MYEKHSSKIHFIVRKRRVVKVNERTKIFQVAETMKPAQQGSYV